MTISVTVIEEVVQATVEEETIGLTVVDQVTLTTVQDSTISSTVVEEVTETTVAEEVLRATIVDQVVEATVQDGITDHGMLSGLGDDDHPQYEHALGNPAADGYLLSSTALGVRSWAVPPSGGGGGGTPGGADTEVQFNDGGAFGGAPALQYISAADQVLIQGQANHSASLGAELLPNPGLIDNMDGWSGIGWSWEFVIDDDAGAMTHDPLETDLLISDDVLADTDDVVLFAFNITNQTQGAVGISLQPPPYLGASSDSYALITGNGTYVLALFTGADDSHLIVDPFPAGQADVFDGRLEATVSAKLIQFSDPVLASRLDSGDGGSLRFHLAGLSSVLIGWLAGKGMSAGAQDNLAIGTGAMEAAWNANTNVGIGSDALRFAPDAQNNVAIGGSALRRGQKARNNIAIGAQALLNAYQSARNVIVGDRALTNFVSGNENTVLGDQAGYALTAGSGNVLIGPQAGGEDTTEVSYRLRISHWISDPEPMFDGDLEQKTLTINADVDVGGDPNRGPILIDRTTAARYRLYVDNGALGIEAV